MKVEAKIVVENAGPVARRGGVAEGKFGEVLDRVVGEAAAPEEALAEEGEPGEPSVVDPPLVGAAEPSAVTVAVTVAETVANPSVPAPVESSLPELTAEEEQPAESIASTSEETATPIPESQVATAAPEVTDPATRDRSPSDAAAAASAQERAGVPASPIRPARSSVAAPTPPETPTYAGAPASAPAAKRASVDAPAPISTASHAPVADAPAPDDERVAAPPSDAPPTHVAEPSTTQAPEATAPVITASTPAAIDATPSLAVEPTATPDVPRPTEPTVSTIDPTLPTTQAAESPDPTPLAEEPTAAPRTSDPEIADRIEKVRTALEKLRPIPDGGVAVDVDLDGIGRVELRVEPIDGGMRVSLGTDEPTALARLEAQRSDLEQALRHNGETLSLDIHTNGRRHRTPRPPAPSRDGDHAPSRADTASPRRSGRGLVDIVA